MGRLLTTRRAEWLPGVALLFAAVGIGGLLGLTADARSWPMYVGAIALVLALGVLAELLLSRRHAPPPPSRARGSFRVIRGGKAAEPQTWLM